MMKSQDLCNKFHLPSVRSFGILSYKRETIIIFKLVIFINGPVLYSLNNLKHNSIIILLNITHKIQYSIKLSVISVVTKMMTAIHLRNM